MARAISLDGVPAPAAPMPETDVYYAETGTYYVPPAGMQVSTARQQAENLGFARFEFNGRLYPTETARLHEAWVAVYGSRANDRLPMDSPLAPRVATPSATSPNPAVQAPPGERRTR